MRISDWSSDVCSSDLPAGVGALAVVDVEEGADLGQDRVETARLVAVRGLHGIAVHRVARPHHLAALALDGADQRRQVLGHLVDAHPADQCQAARLVLRRSEEHTSELQSLMRISYAVFCLKKTNTP